MEDAPDKKKKKSKKQAKKDEEEEEEGKKELKEGEKEGELIEEIQFDTEKFNPFDRASSKKEESLENIKPNQPRKVFKFKK